MSNVEETAEVNIHLRARVQDKMLIDQAAELIGVNRSQFMLASSIKEAKHILLNQSAFYLDNHAFQQVLSKLEAPATSDELEGIKQLLEIKLPWVDER